MIETILILGAGEPQEHFIGYLKRLGYIVYLLSYDENPIAMKKADKYFQVSTLDIEAVYEVAKEYRVDRVIAACTDQALYTMSCVSNRLGLPCYLTIDQVELCTKKNRMKVFMREIGIDSAAFQTVTYQEPVDLRVVNYPAVVKPADCNSSKGVNLVYSAEELNNAISADMMLSRTGTVVIEEYVNGKELTIDGFIVDGKFYLLLVSEIKKTAVGDADFLVIGSETMPEIDTILKNCIISVCQRIVDGLGVKNSPFIAQMINGKDCLKVIEFSLRTGGGEKYKVIEEATGVNVLIELANIMFGNEIHLRPRYSSDVMKTLFVYGKPGKINKISGLKELKEHGIIIAYYLYKEVGDIIGRDIKSSGDRILGFTVSGKNKGEIDAKLIEVTRILSVTDIDGNDMILNLSEERNRLQTPLQTVT